MTAYEGDYPYDYYGYSDDHQAYASLNLSRQGDHYIIGPYTIRAFGSFDLFTANNDSLQVIEPGAFQLSITSWSRKAPSHATIKLDIAYPAGV